MNEQSEHMMRGEDRRAGGGHKERRKSAAQHLVEDELTIKQALEAIGIDKDRRIGSRRSGDERRGLMLPSGAS
ncbi:MAG: hypothetical protein QF830_01445 [Rhodospirillales bacterium]|jgi:hypothetical protein|nr:hypothetical protein [Rhodospirillales bacterium]MDP6882776.1 hypothetical protein [Rhodospirillales bacterium]